MLQRLERARTNVLIKGKKKAKTRKKKKNNNNDNKEKWKVIVKRKKIKLRAFLIETFSHKEIKVVKEDVS